MKNTPETTPNESSLYAAAGKILSADPPKAAYIAAFAAFVLLSGIVSFFHEPWLDEAQGWMIARDASYYDMIFTIPHYEGHPCVWTLLLSVPAKLGAPYELTLGIIMLIISALSAYMAMFRSPLHPLVRLTLPFTYFFFYQYGIIARPYGLMTLGFLLAARFFKNKDEKPFPYVLSLMLLCASSAFGIIISGGLAAVWCFRILGEYGGLKKIFTEFIRTKRFISLLLLLCWAGGLILSILSYDETFTNDTVGITPLTFLRGVWYMLFMLPADGMLVGSGAGLGTLLKYNSFSLRSLITLSLPGAVLTFSLAFFACRKGKLPEFLLPYSLLAVFGAAVYFITHHIGTAVMFFVFIFWICSDCSDNCEPVSAKLSHKLSGNVQDSLKGTGRLINTAMTALCLLMGIVWSISASVMDIRNNYHYGRAAADYIKENGFDSLNIMSSWYYEQDPYGFTIVSADKQHQAVAIDPYFEENIFFNFNCGDPSKGYILHRLSDEANEEQYDIWRETIPDILVGEPFTEIVYGNSDGRRTNYILIKTIPFTQCWKLSGAENYLCIYMRKDLFSEYPDIQPENPADIEFIRDIR